MSKDAKLLKSLFRYSKRLRWKNIRAKLKHNAPDYIVEQAVKKAFADHFIY